MTMHIKGNIQLAGLAGLLILLLSALVMPGCGSSDSEDEASLTKAQFVTKGNAACKKRLKEKDQAATKLALRLQKEVGKYPNQIGSAGKQTAFQTMVDQAVVPSYGVLLGELDDMSQRVEDDGEAEDVVGGLANAVAELEENPSLISKRGAFESPNEAAAEYGLAFCRV